MINQNHIKYFNLIQLKMSFASLVSEIKSIIFTPSKTKKLEKIKPIYDYDIAQTQSDKYYIYTPDIETGDLQFYNRLKARQLALELNTNLEFDLEKGDGSFLCNEVPISINECLHP